MATFTIPLVKMARRDGAAYVMIPSSLLEYPPFMGLNDEGQAYFLLAALRGSRTGGRQPFIEGAHTALRRAGLFLVTEDNDPPNASAVRAPRLTSDELRGDPLNEHAVVMFTFPCDGAPDKVRVFSDFVDEIARLFPSVDVATQINKALAWMLARPERRKTARGMRKFLTGWIDRAVTNGWGR